MKPADIAKAYDDLADVWNADTFPRHNAIAQHERALAFVKKPSRALDVGCGSSGRIIELLTSRGLEVEGIDISPRMIELARLRHPGVTFHEADICEWTVSGTYDLVSAWDSIWHVPIASHERVLRKLLRALSPGGVLIFTMGGLDSPGEKVDAAMGPKVYYSVIGIPRMLEAIATSGCVCRHLEYDQLPESHLYVIAQRKSRP